MYELTMSVQTVVLVRRPQPRSEQTLPEESEITSIDKWRSQNELTRTNKHHLSRARNSTPQEVAIAELQLLHSVFVSNACMLALLIIKCCNCCVSHASSRS